MAPFDITVVGKNLQTFKGTYKYLEEFLTQVEILHDLVDEQDRAIFINYVYNFKLTTQVRNTLGRSNKPTTLAEFKQYLENAYPNPRTLQQVLTELGSIKQQNNNIAEFREKITELSNQLSMFEIANLVNPTQEMKNVVYKLSDSVALNTFLRGVNMEYQQILLSNMPKTLNEAVERCITAERSFQGQNNMTYQINKINNNYRNNNKNNNNNNNNYNNNNNRSYGNNYRRSYNRDNTHNIDNNRSYNNRNYENNRNNNRPNFNRNNSTNNNHNRNHHYGQIHNNNNHRNNTFRPNQGN